MFFDHSSLEPFEPVLRQIHYIVFNYGIEALQKEGIIRNGAELFDTVSASSPAMRRFIRGCHYGYDIAQRKMGVLVIEYERQAREAESELRRARRARDRTKSRDITLLITCLRNRQLVLRRLVDSILYHMIHGDTWVLRRVIAEHRIRDIDPKVLAATLETATALNRSDRLVFHLLTDLTTVVHLGDLVQISFLEKKPKAWKIIELKNGKMNDMLADVIRERGPQLSQEDISKVSEKLGPKASNQLKRMARQQARLSELEKIVATDVGIDPMQQIPTVMSKETVVVDEYSATIRKVCEDAKRERAAAAEVQRCLRLFAVDRKTWLGLGDQGVAHSFFHFQHPEIKCRISDENGAREEIKALDSIFPFFNLTQLNLRLMWPPPIFMWAMPEELIFDLLFGRVLVFAQLDYDVLFAMAREAGVEMSWLGRDEVRLKTGPIPGSPNAYGVLAKPMDPNKPSQQLLVGFFGRMLLEFMTPEQFIRLVVRGLEDFAQRLHEQVSGAATE